MKKLSIFEPQIEKHHAYKKNMYISNNAQEMCHGNTFPRKKGMRKFPNHPQKMYHFLSRLKNVFKGF